jgi:uncharacterized protein (TIGR00251 family)
MLLRIKVKPNAKTDEISKQEDGSWRVKIKAPPVEGKANKYLVEFISGALNLPKSSVVLLKGETNSFKTLQINADETYVWSKLANL